MQDGEPNEAISKPCVPITCPPMEVVDFEIRLMTPEEIKEFYASGKTIF